jgi:hypothetical protein
MITLLAAYAALAFHKKIISFMALALSNMSAKVRRGDKVQALCCQAERRGKLCVRWRYGAGAITT